mgnify:CR=1 FL=1
MESDISFSLCSDQALVESKQCLVDFIHIVVSPFDKIFYNDIEFARTGKGKPCLTEHLLHLASGSSKARANASTVGLDGL